MAVGTSSVTQDTSVQTQVMEAATAADPESLPDDLVLQFTHLLSNMTDHELDHVTSDCYMQMSADEQLLLFFRCGLTYGKKFALIT